MAGFHATVAGVWVDCTLEDGYRLAADVTDSPVERGGDISHHVRPRPEEVTLKGLISNTPIDVPESHLDGASADPSALQIEGEPALLELPLVGILPGLGQVQSVASNLGGDIRSRRKFAADVLHFSAPFDRCGAVEAALRDAVLAGQLVELVTAAHTFPAVILSELDTTRDSSTGQSMIFTVRVRAVRIVDSETIDDADPLYSRSKSAGAGGKVQALDVAAGAIPSSALAKMAGL